MSEYEFLVVNGDRWELLKSYENIATGKQHFEYRNEKLGKDIHFSVVKELLGTPAQTRADLVTIIKDLLKRQGEVKK